LRLLYELQTYCTRKRGDFWANEIGIANFTGLHYVPWGDIAAASVVVTLRLVIMVLIFQQHIISGLTGGAAKE